MRTLDDIPDLKGKHVLMRADFDVPVADGVIQEEFRVAQQRECITELMRRGAQVVLIAHIKDADSFEPLVPQLQRILGMQISFCKNTDEFKEFISHSGSLALLENLRNDPGEESNDEGFARRLADGFDLYVNNAFAVCHRKHASVATVPALLPSYAGPLVVVETDELAKTIDAPAQGKVIYMGGAKASTKVPVIKHLIDNAQAVAVGGVIANDILKELGQDIGSSRVDEDAHELLAGLDLSDARLRLPTDSVLDNGQIFDIGPASAQAFAALAKDASLIVWNGPMGVFEDERYMPGTKVIAQAIAQSGAQKVIGGGDTISAVDKLGLLDRMGFVSTGGGAMLVFLAGQRLPGLEVLGYYDAQK